MTSCKNPQEQNLIVDSGKHLSEVFTEGFLPYGILNKNIPGCGGTTVALESPFDYIVFLPTIELITNKSNQYKPSNNNGEFCKSRDNKIEINIQTVYGNFNNNLKDEINNYLKESNYYETPLKILATYDSAPNLLSFLGERIVNECYILVDEVHSLMIDYNLRERAIENLIEALNGHPKTTYMSATPLSPEHGPYQLEKLPRTNIIWNNVEKPYIFLQKSKSPQRSVKAIIIHDFYEAPLMEANPEKGKVHPDEYFFFLNNVQSINAIISDLPENLHEFMNIICTDSADNRKKLGRHKNLIGSTGSLNRYNFLTKRAFYGCDLYSKRGLSIVVSDVRSNVTLLDTRTDIIQIAGRIRNEENPFKNALVHIFNELPENENFNVNISYNDYINILPKESNSNENYLRYTKFKHFLIRDYYNLEEAYNSNHIRFNNINIEVSFNHELTQYYSGRFSQNLKKIHEHIERYGRLNNLPNILGLFLNTHPSVVSAIDILGFKKIKAFRYRRNEIEQAVKDEEKLNDLRPEILKKLLTLYNVGESYTRNSIKDNLNKIYREFGIREIKSATEIKRYFKVTPTSKFNEKNKSNGALKIISILNENSEND